MVIESWTDHELRILRKLDTPAKIQDFLDALKINFEERGETCRSPRRVLETKKAHCMEGAMLAAAALRMHGYKPLVVDLTSIPDDFDHVLTVFKQHSCWGAITKTNHAVLRYREPIYRSIRELVMSYFHEYFMDNGKKTLRSYSMPVNLARFDSRGWMTAAEDVWYVPEYLARVPHHSILTPAQIRGLRRADPIEVKVGKIVEWKRR